MHEKFVFKMCDIHEIEPLADCGDNDPRRLRSGEAVHLYHDATELVDIGLQPNSAVEIKPHELTPVGYMRRREITGHLRHRRAGAKRIKFEWGSHPTMDKIGAHVAAQGKDIRFYGLMVGRYAIGIMIYVSRGEGKARAGRRELTSSL
jgi:hypothetical protein